MVPPPCRWRQLDSFGQTILRHLPNIKWQDHVTNERLMEMVLQQQCCDWKKGSLVGPCGSPRQYGSSRCGWDARGMPLFRGPTKDALGRQHARMVRLRYQRTQSSSTGKTGCGGSGTSDSSGVQFEEETTGKCLCLLEREKTFQGAPGQWPGGKSGLHCLCEVSGLMKGH